VGVNWSFGIYRLLSVPERNSLKFKRSLSPPIYIYRPQANGFDGKSDGKILRNALFRNFTVKPTRGTRETLQITELLPFWIAELGKSLSFSSTANPEASDRSKSLSRNFMAESIPQSAYRYTGEFRGKYSGNSHSREPTPVCHLLISLLCAREDGLLTCSVIGGFGCEQSGRSRPRPDSRSTHLVSV
jgi:hypothetical protein